VYVFEGRNVKQYFLKNMTSPDSDNALQWSWCWKGHSSPWPFGPVCEKTDDVNCQWKLFSTIFKD
jgi:hypothetical protein